MAKVKWQMCSGNVKSKTCDNQAKYETISGFTVYYLTFYIMNKLEHDGQYKDLTAKRKTIRLLCLVLLLVIHHHYHGYHVSAVNLLDVWV